jgi:hypothetical protein
MNELIDAMDFLDKTRRSMRFGKFSREPLKLLRVEWTESVVECDWLMRPADPWDRFLPKSVADGHVSIQALRDALSLREIVFRAFPRVESADLRMFRRADGDNLELMMTGSVKRSNEVLERVPSVAMRAKLCGFRFTLAQGVLESLHPATLGCI